MHTTPPTSPALPSRTHAKVPTAICRQCFCAVPGDQLETHEAWHANKRKMAS